MCSRTSRWCIRSVLAERGEWFSNDRPIGSQANHRQRPTLGDLIEESRKMRKCRRPVEVIAALLCGLSSALLASAGFWPQAAAARRLRVAPSPTAAEESLRPRRCPWPKRAPPLLSSRAPYAHYYYAVITSAAARRICSSVGSCSSGRGTRFVRPRPEAFLSISSPDQSTATLSSRAPQREGSAVPPSCMSSQFRKILFAKL